MHYLACPKCHLPLSLEGKSYYCQNRHTYDLAKSKYINLLLNPDKATNNPGDSKESLVARNAFLNQGYYDILSDNLIDLIRKYGKQENQILDLGCGEGYYLQRLKQKLDNSENTYYGLDISKEAIHMATRYTKDIYWIVGNSKNLPLLDHSLDFVAAMFTVVNKDELARVLKPGGKIIHVTANNPNHLIEIKHLIYDEVFTKPDTFIRLPFEVVESFDVKETIHIDSHEDCLNLLKMTPHYYHIKKEKRDQLENMAGMDITIDVKFTVYEAAHAL